MVHTFSGRIAAYSAVQAFPSAALAAAASPNPPAQVAPAVQLAQVQSQVAGLHATVAKMRGQYERRAAQAGRPLALRMRTRDSLEFDPVRLCWLWTIECSSPLHSVALQAAGVGVQLREADNTAGCILCISPAGGVAAGAQAGGGSSNDALMTAATMRCSDGTTRLQLWVLAPEGTSGVLRACVVPQLQVETCPMLERRLRPLSLHELLEQKPTPATIAARQGQGEAAGQQHEPAVPAALCTLRVSGDFLLPELHGWLAATLPGVQGKPPGGSTLQLAFQNPLLGTCLTWWVG